MLSLMHWLFGDRITPADEQAYLLATSIAEEALDDAENEIGDDVWQMSREELGQHSAQYRIARNWMSEIEQRYEEG